MLSMYGPLFFEMKCRILGFSAAKTGWKALLHAGTERWEAECELRLG